MIWTKTSLYVYETQNNGWRTGDTILEINNGEENLEFFHNLGSLILTSCEQRI